MSQLSLLDYVPEEKWYKNENELKYYGSALNKFIDKNCSRKMTAINIDLIIQKVHLKRLRLIESKNINESMKKGQKALFRDFLPKVFIFLNKVPKPYFIDYKFDIFLVRGKYPYDNKTEIECLISKKTKFVDKDKLIKFLNFELEFEGI